MYKELEYNLINAKKGDVISINKIVDDFLPLILTSIKRYYNKPLEYEDLIQEGRVVVLECINNYDETKGTFFTGYIKTMLKYLYLDKYKEYRTISLNEPVGEEDEIMNFLESKDPNALELILKKEKSAALRQSLTNLTDRQRQIVISFYFGRKSIHDIAKELNITYRTVVNTKNTALEKLRKELANEYN